MNNHVIVCVLAAGAFTISASAGGTEVTYIETFDDGTNPSDWYLLEPAVPVFIAPSGGNPGGYLTHNITNWPAPVVGTTNATSIFTGDYRAQGVTSVGLDLQVSEAQAQPHPDFSMTLVLEYNSGVPGELTRVFSPSGISIPFPQDGWLSYDFAVPSQETPPPGQLPEGWFYAVDFVGNAYDHHSWDDLIQNVTRISFVGFDDPEAIGFFLNWLIGADNLRMTYIDDEPPPDIPGDLTGDGTVGVDDLLILLAAWGDCPDCADCPADLTGDCAIGVDDLLILLANWG